MDSIGKHNKAHWEWAVASGAGCTVPWLNLSADMVLRFFRGDTHAVPRDMAAQLYPVDAYTSATGKDVLCLATGGGQQSAVFGLLGAQVTVVDITERQLAGDREASEKYGYSATCIQADMRDLSFLEDNSFDLVYQGNCMAWVPDAFEVYREVARIIRPDGRYRVDFSNPATEFMEPDTWNGEGYLLSVPYAVSRIEGPPVGEDPGCVQFRHPMASIFNGLIENGFVIQTVQDAPDLYSDASGQVPGSWHHWLSYVGSFAILAAKKPQGASK